MRHDARIGEHHIDVNRPAAASRHPIVMPQRGSRASRGARSWL
jgi:hypothetical protein